MSETPRQNRLINEKSPYLLQHAHNPVDWYPWGEEAFQIARKLDKPIFLSIGYATCHWCHMMEGESFSDEEIAKLMNETCVNIKVDREELPEVDALYMELAQALMVGAAGWPLNVVLTPELHPFFAMTYVPPRTSPGLVGMLQMLDQVQDMWTGEEREIVNLQSEKIVEAFSGAIHELGEDVPSSEHIENTAELMYKLADPVYGGLKGIPKFPIPCQNCFLLRYLNVEGDARALFFVERSLETILSGGIRDHLGGGLSRYAIDEQWVMPHFEKMVYDNALMLRLLLETWQITKKMLYRSSAQEIIKYLLRDMKHEEGAFFCAEDSDSEGVEGKFYTWTPGEVKAVLGELEGSLFCDFYSVTEMGNFHGRSVIHASLSIKEFCEFRGLIVEEFSHSLEKSRQALLKARQKRVRPLRDEKIISAWNGTVIYSLALAGRVLEDPEYTEAAKSAVAFIKKHLWKDGKLLRRWSLGEARFDGVLDDYAFMISALLMLFEVDSNEAYLSWAIQLNDALEKNFKIQGGTYYTTDGKDPYLLLQRCEYVDEALPAGSAVQCENLIRLYQLTAEEKYLICAEDCLKAVKDYLDGYTPSFSYHLMALQRFLDDQRMTIVIALNSEEEHKREIEHVLAECFIPHGVLMWKHADHKAMDALLPLFKEQNVIEGQTTVYFNSKKGVTSFTDIAEIISSIKEL